MTHCTLYQWRAKALPEPTLAPSDHLSLDEGMQAAYLAEKPFILIDHAAPRGERLYSDSDFFLYWSLAGWVPSLTEPEVRVWRLQHGLRAVDAVPWSRERVVQLRTRTLLWIATLTLTTPPVREGTKIRPGVPVGIRPRNECEVSSGS